MPAHRGTPAIRASRITVLTPSTKTAFPSGANNHERRAPSGRASRQKPVAGPVGGPASGSGRESCRESASQIAREKSKPPSFRLSSLCQPVVARVGGPLRPQRVELAVALERVRPAQLELLELRVVPLPGRDAVHDLVPEQEAEQLLGDDRLVRA